MEAIMIQAAAGILGVKDPSNSFEILSAWEASTKSKEQTDAKIFLLMEIISGQLQTGNKEFYALSAPFDVCPTCKGLGHKIELEYVKTPRSCPFCEGSGVKTIPCKVCDGTGRHANHEGGICKVCKGSGKYRFYALAETEERKGRAQIPCHHCVKKISCPECHGGPDKSSCKTCHGKGKVYEGNRGSGMVNVVESTGNIKSHFFCGHCKGSGRVKLPMNPALKKEDVEAIKESIKHD